MTALTQNISRPYREGDTVSGAGVQAGAHVRQGSRLEIDGSGHVAPAVKGADKSYYGVALTEGKNTGGAAGAVTVTVRLKGAFRFAKTGTAAVGKTAYLADDDTVTDVAAGASACGRIVDADDLGVWVDLEEAS